MNERKVDVTDRAGKVLHTYPITLPASAATPKDSEYETAALAQAKTAKLVPESDIQHLRAKIHAQH